MPARNDFIEDIFLSIYKFFIYFFLYVIFIWGFGKVNYALNSLTRTFVIVSSAFFLVILMMIPVYGNFEIGKEKSKPIFLSTMITVLITNVLAVVTMIIMGIKEFPVTSVIVPSIISLIIVYIIQGIVIYAGAHLGNDLYFKFHKPAPTLIVEHNQMMFNKVNNYVTSYDKQYDLKRVYKSPKFSDIDFKDIKTIFLLDAPIDLEDQLIEYCFKHNIALIYSATTKDLLIASKCTTIIDDLLLVEILPKRLTITQRVLKRLMDIFGSLILLIVSLPITIVVAIMIKREDGGPVFYTQDRYTINRRVFKIYKFRSMKVDVEDVPATDDDDRITKIGHTIRKYRIDEIPQFVNILKGDMSLVGPRAESVVRVTDIKKDFKDFDLRLRVKAGLTGYAQIFGKYNTTPQMKLLLDIKYIENFSILEDIKLLFQTIIVFVKSDSTEGFNEDNDI